jgi:plasmid maintenance system antidote protein VapI
MIAFPMHNPIDLTPNEDGAIAMTERAYFSHRLRLRVRGILLERFFEAQKRGLTKAELARRIGRPPEMVHRWLAAPRNLTLDTMCELLLGISGEEFLLSTAPIQLAETAEPALTASS